MMPNSRILALLFVFFLPAACAGHNPDYNGPQYPPSDRVTKAFQPSQIPDSCRVFAQMLATFPAGYSGQDIDEALSAEAQSRGADMALIGQSRRCEEDAPLSFDYYGPDQEYPIRDWAGWKYGYDVWEKQGEWVGFGYTECGNSGVSYDYSVMSRIAFLRCR